MSREDKILGCVGRHSAMRAHPDHVADHLDLPDSDHRIHRSPDIYFCCTVTEIDHHDHVAALEQEPAASSFDSARPSSKLGFVKSG